MEVNDIVKLGGNEIEEHLPSDSIEHARRCSCGAGSGVQPLGV